MKDFIVLDLETQRSARDVGGWGNIAEMKVSVAVLWDSHRGQFSVYYEDRVMELIARLKSAPLVVGFNHIGFDYAVLAGYFAFGFERENAIRELRALPNLDLLADIKRILGKRLKLDSIVRATLGKSKSADGMLALQWYQDYINGEREKLQMIVDYCTVDVAVTRDLYLYGREHGEIRYIDKILGLRKIQVDWREGDKFRKKAAPVQLSF